KRSRMTLRDFVAFALAAIAAPLIAETPLQPAVQPGGDIPQRFDAPWPPDLSTPGSPGARPGQAQFQYVRREVMIPMRDGIRLYTVLIIPKGAGPFPVVLDRTPYSADIATSQGRLGPLPENI